MLSFEAIESHHKIQEPVSDYLPFIHCGRKISMSEVSLEYQVKAAMDNIKAFDVVGVSVMTDSEKATDDINALWERFFKESIGQAVTHKQSDVIYAVYSDYEGDHTKPYRLTIGYRVTDAATGEGLHHVNVEAGEYAILSAAGAQPQALIETWKSVWESDLEREYTTDFEVYGPRFFEEGVNEVLVHIGVKG